MADEVVFKMFSVIFLYIFTVNVSLSLAVADREEDCSCNNMCSKNLTTNSIDDVQKISACQRGCRFYSLMLHTSRESSQIKILKDAKESCLLSCSESYINSVELSACNFGCYTLESSGIFCNSGEVQTPQISYSFLIEESDVLIQPGEPEIDDSLTDPGLRNQFQKTLIALLDTNPKIPEIRFKNLPVRMEKMSEVFKNLKCPKLYRVDSKVELRNGKIGDLYLFVGVFIFVILCFILGQNIETKNLRRHFMESRFFKSDSFETRESLFKLNYKDSERESNSNYSPSRDEIFHSSNTSRDPYDTKFEEWEEEYRRMYNSIKN